MNMLVMITINNLPVTNIKKWNPNREESLFDYYFILGHEAIFGMIKLNDYRHNKYNVVNNVEGIEIRWNYNIFENDK